jgi:hypothetical protein
MQARPCGGREPKTCRRREPADEMAQRIKSNHPQALSPQPWRKPMSIIRLIHIKIDPSEMVKLYDLVI